MSLLVRIGRRPTARSSGLTGRWSLNGPTADTYDGEAARARQYPEWLHHYNHHRPHSALGGLTPAEVVHNLTGHNT